MTNDLNTTTNTDIQNRIDGKNIIAVASGKGGVGKTWFALTLAHAFSLKGLKVLLIDGDLGLSNIDIQLGINPITNIGEILSNNDPINLAITHDENTKLDIIAGHSGSQTLTGLSTERIQLLAEDIQILAQHYDKVIIDLSTGIEKTVTTLAGIAKQIIVITTNSPTALSDAYSFINIMHQENKSNQVSILVNMANTQKEGEHTYQLLAKACQTFIDTEPKLLGVLRYDTNVRDAINSQSPLLTIAPQCEIAKDVLSLLNQI